MRNFVISLKDRNTSRREHICTEFERQKIKFEFFDAITPKDNIETAKDCRVNIDNSHLSSVEISCALSHIKIWKKVIDENIDTACIFEDDIYLGSEANKFLNNSLWIPENCNIIKLEKFSREILVERKFYKEIYDRSLYKLASGHIGGGGYLITQEAARDLLRRFQKLKAVDAVDIEIFNNFQKDPSYQVYQLLPALCIQEMNLLDNNKLGSSLHPDRLKRWKLEEKLKKLNFLDKLKREILRPFSQIIRHLKAIKHDKKIVDFK